MSVEDLHALSGRDQARLARSLMRRQGGLGLRVAAVFALIILGIPLVNAYLPEVAEMPAYGFTASWLFLGVLIYPVVVALSFSFVSASDRIEADCADWRKALGEGDER